MFDRELSEFTTTAYVLTEKVEGDVRVSVYKVGGGTMGRAYEGAWHVLVESLDESRTYSDAEIVTGTRKTHGQVADLAIDFLD